MKNLREKLNDKTIIAINLFLIFVLMTVSVYAWFASQTDNRVDAYEIQIAANSDLELSFDGNKWAGSLNLSDLKNAVGSSVLDSVKLVDVTSDGNVFRIPQLILKENYAEVNTSGSWITARANRDYIEFNLQMRSRDKLSVYLSSASMATPASAVLTGADCGNPTSYATGSNTFSRDCVVGGLRISFENVDGDRQIWITNPELHLNNKIGSDEYSMDTNAGATSYANGSATEELGKDFFWNNPKVHYYYNGDVLSTYNADKTFYALPESVTEEPAGNATKLAVLDGTADANGYYYSKTTFRIWLEGCDTETRRALVSGKFNLSLVLDAYDIIE